MSSIVRNVTLLLFAATVTACSGGGGTDAAVDSGVDHAPIESGTDAASDTQPADAPNDALDVPIQDAPADQVMGDGSATDLCAAGGVIDLNTAGTLNGNTVTYMGNNATAPATQVTPSCSGGVTNVVVFRYTLHAQSRLIISTFHTATQDHLDTVAWAQTACPITGDNEIGCSDDVRGTPASARPTLPPDGALGQSMFTTVSSAADMTLPASTTVYIFVGGYALASDPWLMTGAFELTVTEITPPLAAGSACDPDDATQCPSMLACGPGGTDYSSFTCVTPGVLNEPCRSTDPGCDTNLGCNIENLCVPQATLGAMCDPTETANVCASGTSCIMGATSSTCVTDGTMNGQCRATAVSAAAAATPACRWSQSAGRATRSV